MGGLVGGMTRGVVGGLFAAPPHKMEHQPPLVMRSGYPQKQWVIFSCLNPAVCSTLVLVVQNLTLHTQPSPCTSLKFLSREHTV